MNEKKLSRPLISLIVSIALIIVGIAGSFILQTNSGKTKMCIRDSAGASPCTAPCAAAHRLHRAHPCLLYTSGAIDQISGQLVELCAGQGHIQVLGAGSIGSDEGQVDLAAHCAGPVSYTHLDVYKRQPMWWAVPTARSSISTFKEA